MFLFQFILPINLELIFLRHISVSAEFAQLNYYLPHLPGHCCKKSSCIFLCSTEREQLPGIQYISCLAVFLFHMIVQIKISFTMPTPGEQNPYFSIYLCHCGEYTLVKSVGLLNAHMVNVFYWICYRKGRKLYRLLFQ